VALYRKGTLWGCFRYLFPQKASPACISLKQQDFYPNNSYGLKGPQKSLPESLPRSVGVAKLARRATPGEGRAAPASGANGATFWRIFNYLRRTAGWRTRNYYRHSGSAPDSHLRLIFARREIDPRG
jgi:hypothetical protein